MKSLLIPAVFVLLLVGCSREPDPKIAQLESRVQKLEDQVNKTAQLVYQVGDMVQTQGKFINNTQSRVDLMSPQMTVDQLKSGLSEYIELSRRRNDLVDQKLKILAEEVFHNSDKH